MQCVHSRRAPTACPSPANLQAPPPSIPCRKAPPSAAHINNKRPTFCTLVSSLRSSCASCTTSASSFTARSSVPVQAQQARTPKSSSAVAVRRRWCSDDGPARVHAGPSWTPVIKLPLQRLLAQPGSPPCMLLTQKAVVPTATNCGAGFRHRTRQQAAPARLEHPEAGYPPAISPVTRAPPGAGCSEVTRR